MFKNFLTCGSVCFTYFLLKQQQQARGEDGEPSRSERMHQLRAEHQRRHAQRNRTYPTDDMEEHYESAIRQVG